jgi:hypothetical protein
VESNFLFCIGFSKKFCHSWGIEAILGRLYVSILHVFVCFKFLHTNKIEKFFKNKKYFCTFSQQYISFIIKEKQA